ncbi:BREX-1 system adenine-specific DNA-methyltransferase PglX [Paraoerskovia marina]|uniref:BREX-1 system adenine-specific DNA-methyltransferase PglX n=1 Tax=Paraoerskovia marina TaxID=545619 RepID=UPI000492A3BE|nr:BREX-1 system adenine-specific DNA-methyltransferase PglX [Paraoerskovia marina]
MDTAPLKSFAISARTELIREVGARIAAVLAPGSPERVEQPRAVTALERAIAAQGGDFSGKAYVTDKVAYIWFNRIIALRFMDANGYTDLGVVSPAADQVGQPEVLASAKRGQIDGDVVRGANVAIITGLLDGTRPPRSGGDAQTEAYALLLADYCRYWNQAMPFMFEREGGYTELLIPANLLAEESALSRSVKVLSEEVCQDVEVIGWLYQFYISERKDEVFAGFKKNKKAGADEIPAATQLFTPHWIVRYLVENSLGRLWMLNHPESRLVDQMDYYIAPVDEEPDILEISTPEELNVIDPACGSGHMLTYAFDLLYAIYEEEGYTPSEIPSLILTNNLYGTEIDPRAGALAAFALTMKATSRRKRFLKDAVEPHVCVIEPVSFSADELDFLLSLGGDRGAEEAFWNLFSKADTCGSLVNPPTGQADRLARHLGVLGAGDDLLQSDIVARANRVVRQASYLTPKYAVAIANPPYMGSKNMGGPLAEYIARRFPEAKSDLYSAFIERCHELVPRGFVAMITMQSWTFQTTFGKFRSSLLETSTLVAMIGLGTGAFDSFGGEVVNTCAFITSRGGLRSTVGAFHRMEEHGESAMSREFRRARETGLLSRIASSEFKSFPNSVIAYWLTPKQAHHLSHDDPISSVADARVGLQTGDNDRFLRYWWEVSYATTQMSRSDSDEARWLPYSKGGPFRKWFGNMEMVVDWAQDGADIKSNRDAAGKLRARPQNQRYYGRPAVEWSDIGQPVLGARLRDTGTMFDVVSMSLFSPSDDYDDLLTFLAYLNSSVADLYIKAVAPGMHANTGYVSVLPWRNPTERLRVARRAEHCIEIARRNWERRETAIGFRELDVLAATRAASGAVAAGAQAVVDQVAQDIKAMAAAETANNAEFNALFRLDGEAQEEVHVDEVTLDTPSAASLASELVSVAVGCMFGRYSLDEPGLIVADQGMTLQEYLQKVPTPSFVPDADNVIPVVDGDWFEDDIVDRFRQFLRAAFGDEYFEANLRFVTESLGVKNLRTYFVKSFYKDHVQRYRRRPIYWLFSSPSGSFSALVYMHRYSPTTVSTVLSYLREYVTKLESTLQQVERVGNAKEADRLRKVLLELKGYEHDILYPKASENVAIALGDGVKANYPKFGAALKKVPGLEAASD